MVAQTGSPESRTSVAMNLQFTRGRHGTAARLEVHERPAGRVGLLALRGWVDLSAERGIERALDDLATRGLARLVVDCSQLLHVDYRLVPRLPGAPPRPAGHARAAGPAGLVRLVVDCSQLLHVDCRLVPRLADALVRIEAHAGAVVLCGLSRYLRDLFRIAGCESKLCSWPNASDLLDAAPDAAGRERERAS